jgi:hemerythrin-like domain-containing protein
MGDVGPIGDLKRQHEVLQAEMRGIMEMARELRGDALQQARQSFSERLVFFRQALDLHCLREEEALFPEARELATAPARSGGAEQADLLGRFLEGEGEDDMRAHSLVSARMEQISRLLGGEMDEGAVTRLRALASAAQSLLDSHCAKEDTMIFPIIEQALTPDQMAWVWERMQAVRTGTEAEREGAMGMRRLGE